MKVGSAVAIATVLTWAACPAAGATTEPEQVVWDSDRILSRVLPDPEPVSFFVRLPIAHAAAQTHDPVRQGTVAMLGTFIDTLVVCTITGLVIVVSGEWVSGQTGAALSSAAFESSLPGFGSNIVALGLSLFAFTTMLGWSVYGERCAEYLFGVRRSDLSASLGCSRFPSVRWASSTSSGCWRIPSTP